MINDFEWIASLCFLIWVITLAEQIPILTGYGLIIMILIIYFLFKNDYFGGK